MTKRSGLTYITYRLKTGIYRHQTVLTTHDRAEIESEIVRIMAWGGDPATITVILY